MKVHRKMGPGYTELIYSRCLAIEFDRMGIRYKKEQELNIYYDEFVVGKRRVDFMVEEKIVLEPKAISALTNKELAQSINYLESSRQEIGLLINFGSGSLQFKRVINQKKSNGQANPVNP